ncbi:hypothetical protein [Oceanobacillus sp. CAU 1775]
MKLQITTFVIVGAFLGFLTDGIMIGAGVAAIIFIGYRLEKYLDNKNI